MHVLHIGERDWISGIGVGSTVAFPRRVFVIAIISYLYLTLLKPSCYPLCRQRF